MTINYRQDYKGFFETLGNQVIIFASKLLPDNHDEIVIQFVTPNDKYQLCIPSNNQSPFRSSPPNGQIGICHAIIDSLGLTFYEEYACILHEVGHFFYVASGQNTTDLEKEIYCDLFAADLGYASHLASALDKMKEIIPQDELIIRKEKLESAQRTHN